jgi:hypothetical protein
LTEKDVDEADSISISRKLSLRSSFSATSECGDDPELSCVVELKNPMLDASGDENMESAVPIDSKEPSSGILEDDGGLKEVVQLMESSSGLGEKGGKDQPTTVVVESNKPLSGSIGEKEDGAREIDDLMKPSSRLDEEGDNDHPMVDVVSKEALSGSQEEEGDEDQPMVAVESKEAASGSVEEADEDQPVVAFNSRKHYPRKQHQLWRRVKINTCLLSIRRKQRLI